jgi:hypothetical protein
MKLKIGVVATVLVLGCSAFSKAPVPVDDEVVGSIYELESLFVEQQYQPPPISPPSEDVYVHSHETAGPVDWKFFPKEFTSQMYAEMDANGYPVYRVSIYEDPITRQTVFLNSGYEIFRLDAATDYDPYARQKERFTLEPGQELAGPRQRIYDPAHIAVDFILIPEVFHEDYLAMQEEQATQELAMAPMSMMMSLPAVVTNLQMAINNTTNDAVELEIGWPVSFTNELEIFATTDLSEHVWQVVYTGVITSNATNFLWTDWTSTNTPNRFYVASKSDVDTDGDGLADGREIYVYGSKPDELDSDNDGLDDDVEVGASPPTNPSDDDRQAPAISIASPVNNIVVVP